MVVLQKSNCLLGSLKAINKLETSEKGEEPLFEHFLKRSFYPDLNYTPLKGKLKNCENSLLSKLLHEFCEDCFNMAAIPQGAFVACKMRENYRERDLLISRMKPGGSGDRNEKPESKHVPFNRKMLEYSPVKYNSKLMNSIWGLYNRYSPHNIKSNDDVKQPYLLQQRNAVAGYAIAQNIAVAMDSAKEWGFVDN